MNEIETKTITRRELELMVESICYDRQECRRIGVDYNRLNANDIHKIRSSLLQVYNVVERGVEE